jgi:hypothetical protein
VTDGSDAMRDVYAKLSWAEKHLVDLTDLAREYIRPDGGDERPLGIAFDDTRLPVVIARFIIEEPPPPDIALHAADLIHNARTALDHVVARLKEHFGGNVRQGTYPITESDADWKGRVYPRRQNGERAPGPLDGLPCAARTLIYREQPHVAYPGRRHDDPMAVLSKMDNDDKHRLLHPAFVYPNAERGLDLIEVRNQKRVLSARNSWRTGQPLEDGTVMARYVVRGPAKGLLRVRQDAEGKLSTGPVGGPRVTYEDIITRVRDTPTRRPH